MGQSEELRLLALTPSELRLLLAFRHLEDRWHEVHATMEELGQLTGYSRASLSRALGGLQEAGFVKTTRTKRNFGMLSRNKYVLPPRLTTETSEAKNTPEPCVINETSTTSINIDSSSITTVITKTINPTGLLVADATREGKVDMVNKWSEDDEVGGFGLFDTETPASQKAKPISKRDPKTRSLRPQDEWTAADVASEFSFRVYDKVRGIPGIVNTANLRQALARNRSQFGITALIEMEVMERFFSDERNITSIRKFPTGAMGMFLKSITNNVGNVIDDLGLGDATPAVAPVQSLVYASDGRGFDNSISGRAAMKQHESKLKGK
jgi:hypothetical protein